MWAGWSIIPCIFQEGEAGSNVIELLNHVSWKVLEGGHGLVIYCGGQGCNGFIVPDDAQSVETGGEED